jgi:hypothetical protein
VAHAVVQDGLRRIISERAVAHRAPAIDAR